MTDKYEKDAHFWGTYERKSDQRTTYCVDGVEYSTPEEMMREILVLRAKVEWLRKAEHLVLWDGEKFVKRPEVEGRPL